MVSFSMIYLSFIFVIPITSSFLMQGNFVSSQGGSSPRYQMAYLEDELVFDNVPTKFQALFAAAVNATVMKGANSADGAHDSFRYEWGTWCIDENMAYLMDRIDEVRLNSDVYDNVMQSIVKENNEFSEVVSFRVASGKDWDCVLYFLPPKAEWRGRRPSGSWTIVKTLSGLAQVSALSGPDRDGKYKRKTSKDLWGGGDGSFAGGTSSSGLDCIKYVGGPLRSYLGKAGKTVVFEMVIQPPPAGLDGNSYREEMERLHNIDQFLSIVEILPAPTVEKISESKPTMTVSESSRHLGNSIGMSFEKVGGLDAQLDAIARRVLASRANPEVAQRLGVSHVRGILLSGPPGCGKTLLARELAHLLGAREPQIVNGPEILDKFIGEAEKNVRALFAPAEQEYRAVGDASALHIIILDEMDAIARKRGSMSSDTTGVRDSVVNQLLAKMDGVKEANNVLVVGLTNRPELLDPALLRPGRFEVQLRVELPDLVGRRDILRIHTRRMRDSGGVNISVLDMIDDLNENGLPAKCEHFTGAELAGLVRSAASHALARTLGGKNEDGLVGVSDIEKALKEVRPALGKQDEVLKTRFPFGISIFSSSTKRILRDLSRFLAPSHFTAPRMQSLLLVGGEGCGGTGVTALAAWAASDASSKGSYDYVRLITALDLLVGGGGSDEANRAAALTEKFSEARELSHSLLVLDDVDFLCAGSRSDGYSSVMLATLRALLRSPPSGKSAAPKGGGKTIHILATTSRSDAACTTLYELFDEVIVVPLLSKSEEVQALLEGSFGNLIENPEEMAKTIISMTGKVSCKTALRLAERAVSISNFDGADLKGDRQLTALSQILDDLSGDKLMAESLCEIIA